MPKANITQAWVNSVAPSPKGHVIYMDAGGVHSQTGFGVRVSPAGQKSFIVQRGKGGLKERGVIGHPDRMTVAMARERAKEILGRMAKDPTLKLKDILKEPITEFQQQRAAEKRTFGLVYRQYLPAHGDGTFNKDGSPRDPEPAPVIPERKRKGRSPETIRDRRKVIALLEKKPIWKTPIADLTADHVDEAVAALFAEKGVPTRALGSGWKCLRYGRAAFNWECLRTKGDLRKEANPFAEWMRVHKPDLPEVRESRLRMHEPRDQIWLQELVKVRLNEDLSLQMRVSADYFLCVALFGGRRTETQRLCLDHIDLDSPQPYAFFRKENTKGGQAHYFPLTPWAVDILRNRVNKLKAEAAKKNGVIPGPDGGWLFQARTREDYDANKLAPSSYGPRELLKHLQAKAQVRYTLHDLRRTLASQLASQSKYNLGLVALALNHAAPKGNTSQVTPAYVSRDAKIEELRPQYLKWERTLRITAGLEAPPNLANLPPALQAALADPQMREVLLAALEAQGSV